MKIVKNVSTDLERAFYHSNDVKFIKCTFDGVNDGESAIKESRDIIVEECFFNLRYPFWHVNNLTIRDSEMTDKCRAAIWYTNNTLIENSKLLGIKVIRECQNIKISDSIIDSKESFWMTNNIRIDDSGIVGEYPFMHCNNIELVSVKLEGKYSFQYSTNITIENCVFDTKDAFWHSSNVTVKDSIINGEYLGWYSKGLHFINCVIKGTQPMCYCEDLVLENCTLIDCDLAFEYSSVNATIVSDVISIKNPKSGRIECKNIQEVILDDNFIDEGIEIINKKTVS